MAKKEQRFIKVMEDSGFISSSEVLVDTQTGVQYLYHAVGNSGGLTLLVDADGKPLVPQDAGRTGILSKKGSTPRGASFFASLYDSSWAGLNTRAAISESASSDAPVSAVRLYAKPGARSRQMMQPAPPASQRRTVGHQRSLPSAVRLPPVKAEMSGIVSETSKVGAMR